VRGKLNKINKFPNHTVTANRRQQKVPYPYEPKRQPQKFKKIMKFKSMESKVFSEALTEYVTQQKLTSVEVVHLQIKKAVT
jgi:hypothetical protein